jgi:APA family basic amino acid/polyamine antiporter
VSEPVRGLGALDASLIVVGSIVGGGIFLVSGEVARHVQSPAGFLAVWLLGGAVALAGALCNAELGGMFPRGGGEYVYLREAYGRGLAFLSGWTSFWIGFPGSVAALAWGLGVTVAGIFGLEAPFDLAIALASIAALTLVDARGLEPGRRVQNLLSGVKLVVFALLLCGAALRGGSSALHPFVGAESPTGLALALVPVLFAYSGWNAATYVAGELRDPARSLRRALVFGTVTCVALYLAVNLTYLRAIPLDEMRAVTDVARTSAERLGGSLAAAVLGPLVAVSIASSLKATVTVGPRIYQAMAADGLFFAPLGRLGRRSRVPEIGLAAQAAIACLLLTTRSFEQLLTFTMFAIVTFSTLTVAGVLILRARRPDASRPFRVPGHPWLPIAFVAVNGWVLWCVLSSGVVEALAGAAIVASGLPAYALFRARQRGGPRPDSGTAAP